MTDQSKKNEPTKYNPHKVVYPPVQSVSTTATAGAKKNVIDLPFSPQDVRDNASKESNLDFVHKIARSFEDADMSDFLHESDEAPALASFLSDVMSDMSRALLALEAELRAIKDGKR